LRATKAVMVAGGVIASEAVRHPLEPLQAEARAGLMQLAKALDPVAMRWGK
jgi:2-keto-3-deoxy-L-arabinonate dehydratase